MSVFPVSPLATTPSEATLFDGHVVPHDPRAQSSHHPQNHLEDGATSRRRNAAYLALSPGTHIFDTTRGLLPPAFGSAAQGAGLHASASSLPLSEARPEFVTDVAQRARRLLEHHPSGSSLDSSEMLSDDAVTDSAWMQDGWQLEAPVPSTLMQSLADLCIELLPKGKKDALFGNRLVLSRGLTPLLKDLSCVKTARGDHFLMTPSLVGEGETAGAFGKFRLALDRFGMLLAVKQVRTAEAQLHKLARYGFDLRGQGTLRQGITDPAAFCFELAVAKAVGRDFFHAGLSRIDGKLLSFHKLYAGGSVTRLFDAPLRLREPITLRVIKDVAKDLARLQALRLVHRDVRPPNIMWDDSGFFLQDYGSTRVLGLDDTLPHTDATFAPPETYGPQRRVWAQTDAWSLGLTAMSLLPSDVLSPFPLDFLMEPHDAYESGIDEFENWRYLYLADPERALSSPTPEMSPITRQCRAFFAERSLIAPKTVDVALRYLLAARPWARASSFDIVVTAAEAALEGQNRLDVMTQLWLTDKLQRGPDDRLAMWKRRLLVAREAWLQQVVHQPHDGAADT